MVKNFLITTIGGITSPEIIKAIKKIKKSYWILGVDQNKNAIGKFFVDKFSVVPFSKNSPQKFIKIINNLIKKYKIDCLIPLGNDDNLVLNKFKKKITCSLLNSLQFSDKNYFDKINVYNTLKDNKLNSCPEYYVVKKNIDFEIAKKKLNYKNNNLILKPSLSTGGRGVFELLNSLKDKKIFSKRLDNNLLSYHDFRNILKDNKQELILMKKYNSKIYSVYSLCFNGVSFFSITHVREWGNASQTYRGKVFVDLKLTRISSKIINCLKLSYLINMEFVLDENKVFKLIDLNPRIGASAAIHAEEGINLLSCALELLINKKILIPKSFFKFKKTFYRFFEKVWI